MAPTIKLEADAEKMLVAISKKCPDKFNKNSYFINCSVLSDDCYYAIKDKHKDPF